MPDTSKGYPFKPPLFCQLLSHCRASSGSPQGLLKTDAVNASCSASCANIDSEAAVSSICPDHTPSRMIQATQLYTEITPA